MRLPSRFCSLLAAATLATSVTACADEGEVLDEGEDAVSEDEGTDEVLFKRGCATLDLSPEELAADDLVMARTASNEAGSLRAAGTPINVYWHRIHDAKGNGGVVTSAQINAQIQVL